MYSISSIGGTNLFDAFSFYAVCLDNLKAETKEKIKVYTDEEDGWIMLPYSLIDELATKDEDIFDSVDFNDFYFDRDWFDSWMAGAIKTANSYLVFSVGCRWNGGSGYKIADSLEDAFSRDYDSSIYLNNVSKGGKTLVCSESSHDVPMGSTTYIIALTDKEREKLDYARFETVENFVERCAAKVA